MNMKLNSYIIGGVVLLLLVIIVSNMELKSNNLRISVGSSITPEVAKQVALSPPTTTQYMTPEQYMRKQLEDYGLPDTDEYMTQSLRDQLEDLNNKFYYDNCRYATL